MLFDSLVCQSFDPHGLKFFYLSIYAHNVLANNDIEIIHITLYIICLNQKKIETCLYNLIIYDHYEQCDNCVEIMNDSMLVNK